MESPHFEVTYHEGLYPLALHAIRSLERAHELLVPYLDTEPNRKTRVLLSDDTDAANGSATAFGRPQIWLLAEPPDALSVLGDYDDYVFLLVAHEYVHVLHLGTVNGLPSWLNRLLGDVWIPNAMQPRFMVEGLATYQESLVSGAGRMRSALFDMFLRADVLDDRLLDLGEISHGPGRWPWGTAWYLYGGKLVEYLATTRGDEALKAYSHTYGSSLVPWSMNLDLTTSAGVDWVQLYDEWIASLKAQVALQKGLVEARGPLTTPTLRTHHGESTGRPRWGPDGTTLYYVEATGHRRPWLRALDRETGADRPIHDLGASGEIAPLPGTGVILSRLEVLRAHRTFGDLYRVDDSGETRLTVGARASEVDLSPDGTTLVYVRREAGRTRLMMASLATPEDTWPVYTPPGGRQVHTPRFSPDGSRIVFTETREAHGRDLVLLDLATSQAHKLTDDGALDTGPTFWPGTEKVVFSSDRDGVFNLHAIDLSNGSLERLTNVLTGAFEPTFTADGSWLAFTTYSSFGFDVAALPVDELHPIPAAPFEDERPARKVAPETHLYPTRPYSPLETLGPQTWFPYLAADSAGTVIGLQVSGSDIVGLHEWSLTGGYGLASREPQVGGVWSWHGWFPTLTFAASSAASEVAGFPDGTWERVTGAGLSLTFPWASTRRAQSFTVGYDTSWFEPLHFDPADRPDAGLATEVHVGWAFSSAESPPEAISPEDGIGLAAGVNFGSPSLGGDFSYTALNLSGSAFLRLPWARHHVLAFLARGGIGSGDLGDRRLFSLGGPVLRDPLLDLLYTGRFVGTGILRGYEPGAFVGSHLLLGTVEYRLPLLHLDRGPWTLPFYAGRLSGAIFVEAGDAFDGFGAARLHPAAGAELRLNVLAGNLAGAIRLGYGHGFDRPEGGHRAYLGIGAGF